MPSSALAAMSHSILRTVLPLTVLVSACASGPAPHSNTELPFEVASRWQTDHQQDLEQSAEVGWLQQLRSPPLMALVTDLMSNNANVNILMQRLLIAGYRIDQRDADSGLQMATEFGVERLQSVSGDQNSETFSVQLDMSWEWDLWGRQSFLQQQAQWQQVSALREFEYGIFSAVAQLAQLWISVVELAQLQQLSHEAVDNWRLLEASIARDYRTGRASFADLKRVRTDLALAQVSGFASQRKLGDAVRQLKRLLGEYPNADTSAWQAPLLEMPQVPAPVSLSSPVQLMLERPDILMAQARLASSDAAAAAAYAALLPTLSLSLVPQLLSGDISSLSNHSASLGVSMDVLQPLLGRNRLLAERDIAQAEAHISYWQYVDVLLKAFAEVEQSLHNESQLRLEGQAQLRAATDALAASQASRRDYDRGLLGLPDYLDSQRLALLLQQQNVSKQAQRLRNWINLQLALGRPVSPSVTSPVS